MPGPLDLVLGAAPCVAWLFWIHREDAREPEPWRLVVAVFLLGGMAAIAQVSLRPRVEALFLTGGLGLSAEVADAFIVTALMEESVKFLALALGALWHSEWDEPLDGVVYGAAAGLGFAAIENAYFFAATGDPAVVVARGFTSTLAHVAFSGGLGFFVGLARLRHRRRVLPWLLAGGAYAVGAHGIYDWLAMSNPVHRALLSTALVLLVVGLAVKIRWARARSHEYHPTAESARTP